MSERSTLIPVTSGHDGTTIYVAKDKIVTAWTGAFPTTPLALTGIELVTAADSGQGVLWIRETIDQFRVLYDNA